MGPEHQVVKKQILLTEVETKGNVPFFMKKKTERPFRRLWRIEEGVYAKEPC